MSENIQIESVLQKRIDSGKKALVVYITGGLGEDWIQTMHSVIDAGADVVEIDIDTKDTKIFMYNDNKKVNIQSIK